MEVLFPTWHSMIIITHAIRKVGKKQKREKGRGLYKYHSVTESLTREYKFLGYNLSEESNSTIEIKIRQYIYTHNTKHSQHSLLYE